jgi:hypothetical protein
MTGTLAIACNAFIIIAFGVAVMNVGFYPAASCYLFVHMAWLGVRPWWLVVLVTAGAVGFIALLFDFALGVPVPRSALF